MTHDTEASLDLGVEHQNNFRTPYAGSATPIRLSRTAATAKPDQTPLDLPRTGVWQRSFRARRLLADVVVLALIAVLAFALWPARLGGATSYVIIKGTSMEPKFHTGDLAVVRTQDHYNVGDIVAYRIPKGGPGAGKMVIHRIIGHHHGGYLMQGDNRTTPDTWNPTDPEVVGRYRMLVPIPGIGFWMLMPWVFCASIGLSVMWILWPRKIIDESAEHPGHADRDGVDPGSPFDPLFGQVSTVTVGQRRLRRLEREAAQTGRGAHRKARRRADRRITTGLAPGRPETV